MPSTRTARALESRRPALIRPSQRRCAGADCTGDRLPGLHIYTSRPCPEMRANLARAALINVWLEDADLTDADLRQASLKGCHLTRADLSRADLSQADLRGANLSNAILDNTVLTDAQADTSTIWPTAFNSQRRRKLGIIEAGNNNPAQMG